MKAIEECLELLSNRVIEQVINVEVNEFWRHYSNGIYYRCALNIKYATPINMGYYTAY